MTSPKVPRPEDAGDKWLGRVKVAAPAFEFKVKNPLRIWIEEFEAAKERIQEGMRDAAEAMTFLSGAARVGQPKWAMRTADKGVPRWRDETPKRVAEFKKEVAGPFADIASAIMELKHKKGDPANIDGRVKPVVERLVAGRKARRGGK